MGYCDTINAERGGTEANSGMAEKLLVTDIEYIAYLPYILYKH